jgi:predicted nucleotidyltransferase
MGRDPFPPDMAERLAAVFHSHGVVHASVFGSVARGTATDESDVDFLVEFEPSRSLLDLASLELDLAALLGRPVDVVTFRALNPHLRDQALREQVGIL